MLVLSRKVGESIKIGDGITVVVSRISGNRVTLGLEAPREMRIIRGELRPFTEAVNERPQAGTPAAREPEVRRSLPQAVTIETRNMTYLPRRAR